MNQFKESIDKIKMSEEEKSKMLRNILNKEEKEKKVGRFVPRLATFLIAFILLSGTCYALVKVLHFDNTLKLWFDKSDEELSEYGVGATEVNTKKEFDDATIVINQTIVDEKEIFISVTITGKNKEINLDSYYLTKGTSFDESALETTTLENGTKDVSANPDNENIIGATSSGFGWLEESGLTNKYTLELDVDNEIGEKEDVTLRLVSSEGKTYDVSFTLSKNDMKEKESTYNKVVYDEDGITITVTSIRLTPLHVIVDMTYSKDVTLLTDEEIVKIGDAVYNDNSKGTSYVTYKDGTTTELRLLYSGETASMLSPYGTHGTKEDQVNDIEDIQSVTINNITFEIQ
jgi:hypothetical protein